MSKQSFSFMESIIAIGALVTSSAAVFIAWDQANVMHTEQKASVLPAIQIDAFEAKDNATYYYGFNVENAGVGPAFLQGAVLTIKGEPVQGQEHLQSELPLGAGLDITTEPMTGRVIAPAVSKQALRFAWRIDPFDGVPREINVATGDLALEICYCDTLKNCWTSKSGQKSHPKSVGSCPKPKEGLF